MENGTERTKGNGFLIAATAAISIFATVLVGAIVLWAVGVERASEEVSPFVEKAKGRLTEGVVPETKRGDEPKTDADLIMDAVAANSGNAVTIHRRESSGSQGGDFVARGIVIASDGLVATDAGVVTEGGEYAVVVPGVRDRADAEFVALSGGVALLRVDLSTSMVGRFSDEVPSAEQLVVALTGDERMRIATGIVTGIDTESGVVSTNIVGAVAPGSPLVAKDGTVIGISAVGVQSLDKASFLLLSKTVVDELRKIQLSR